MRVTLRAMAKKTPPEHAAPLPPLPPLPTKVYEKELRRLPGELGQLPERTRRSGARLAVIFEGRDGAGKGGTISRITQYLNPRVVKVAALPAPSDRERSQWYFQRYVEHLPS